MSKDIVIYIDMRINKGDDQSEITRHLVFNVHEGMDIEQLYSHVSAMSRSVAQHAKNLFLRKGDDG